MKRYFFSKSQSRVDMWIMMEVAILFTHGHVFTGIAVIVIAALIVPSLERMIVWGDGKLY